MKGGGMIYRQKDGSSGRVPVPCEAVRAAGSS